MKKRRGPLTEINAQQEKILFPFFLSCLFTLFCVVLLMMIQNPLFNGVSIFSIPTSGSLSGLALIQVFFAAIIAVGFLALCYWAVQVSHQFLGAYDRILRELDGIIANRSQGPVRVRPGDEMFAALLNRVNILIERRRDEQERLQETWYEEQMGPKGLSPRDIFWGN